MQSSSGGVWLQVIVALSIFVPLIVAIWLAWFFLRGRSTDPDEQRLRRAQAHARAAREAERARGDRPRS